VAPSTYYAAKKRQLAPSTRAVRHIAMMQIVMALFVANRRSTGAHQLWKAARRAGHDEGRDEVARLMRSSGSPASHGAGRSSPSARTRTLRAPDLLKRQFVADRPNGLWMTDLTSVPTRMVLHLLGRRRLQPADRRWPVAAHMRTEMVLEALEMARRSRAAGRLVGRIAHSDPGSQGGFNWSSQHLDEAGSYA
jgi:putative transposase